ncbi:MAG: phosphatase PAP2 family protein, partial [Sphingobacteriia bacterium]|nr:phosphatase PAP2 family protein [Sphingobacteriia bacterium]
CRYPDTASDCHLLVQCGSGFSFVSSHASNHFALAWTLGLIMLRRWKSTGLIVGSLWASLVSWSQMRVGVHFPLDIALGAFLGVLIALSLWLVMNKIDGSSKPELPS